MTTLSNNMPARIWLINGHVYSPIGREDSVPGVAYHRADIVGQLVEALRIIAGERQCIDNLMGNADVANAALVAYRESING